MAYSSDIGNCRAVCVFPMEKEAKKIKEREIPKAAALGVVFCSENYIEKGYQYPYNIDRDDIVTINIELTY